MKQTVVFDFDGVIHSYTSGWQGPDVIPDPPVPGIKEAIEEIRAAGYAVVVVSTRCTTEKGYGAIRAWLIDNEIEVDALMTGKPPAIAYIDDRAICFDGKPEELLSKIRTFKPWNARCGVSKVTVSEERIAHLMETAKVEVKTIFDKCTVMAVQLENGFIIVESSACVDPANYDPKLGRKICADRIIDKMWELEGYALQKAVYEEKKR